MSSPERNPGDWPNPEAKRYPRPGEPSPRFQSAVVAALLACGWLGVAVSGLCTAGFMNLTGSGFWRGLLTVEGFFGGMLFLLMFGFVPVGGGIAMIIFTRRAWRNRWSRRKPGANPDVFT